MKRKLFWLFFLVLVFAVSGCYTLNVIGTPADPTFSMSNHPPGSVIKHFSVTMTVHHFIYGLVTLNDPDVVKALSDEVKAAGGDNAINVKVHYEMPFVYGLVNAITFGVYNPFMLTVEGDVVK